RSGQNTQESQDVRDETWSQQQRSTERQHHSFHHLPGGNFAGSHSLIDPEQGMNALASQQINTGSSRAENQHQGRQQTDVTAHLDQQRQLQYWKDNKQQKQVTHSGSCRKAAEGGSSSSDRTLFGER